MPILFLDFDGVLDPEHCHESRHFCRLPILEEALRQVLECTLTSYPREAECHAWRWANGVPHLPWLAVDDRSWNYRPFCNSLLLVDGATGITGVTGAKLVARLQQLL